ncbi:hypothetical protein AALP_AA6G186800 [Arabis alpina]|uniref:Uncharacterized protein n=1 Tax=Arabis alpina TaxID=50452 RepID=A0A087GQ46_ARAAL|nr:hypothetical protein AALP_AA6G186800 [Arabis alpina]
MRILRVAKRGTSSAKSKDVEKPSNTKREEVYKDVNAILTTKDDDELERAIDEGLTDMFNVITIIVPREDKANPKETINKKLENTLKLFLKAIVVKYDNGDMPKNSIGDEKSTAKEAKGVTNPLVDSPEA